MIKGIEKRVVVLKNTNSDLFEEAIFIIKNGKVKNKRDMLIECERIINKVSPRIEKKKRKFSRKMFISIFAISLAMIIILTLICVL